MLFRPGNVHEIARQFAPDARGCYVGNDRRKSGCVHAWSDFGLQRCAVRRWLCGQRGSQHLFQRRVSIRLREHPGCADAGGGGLGRPTPAESCIPRQVP